jgi:ubiquinone/menaquinone biosynthesis C-methylase UbiE
MTDFVDAAGAYNRWAATYDSDANLTRDLDAIVLRAAELELDGAQVLELGCGTGKNTVWLAEHAESLVAMDFSDGMIALARERVGDAPHVRFVRHDVRGPWPVDGESADVVIGNLVLEHVENVVAVFTEIARVLRPGGVAFLCELHPDRQRRGSRAQFTDAQTGERIFVEAYMHSERDFEDAAAGAGLTVVRFTSHLEAGAPIEAPARLLAMRFRKDR